MKLSTILSSLLLVGMLTACKGGGGDDEVVAESRAPASKKECLKEAQELLEDLQDDANWESKLVLSEGCSELPEIQKVLNDGKCLLSYLNQDDYKSLEGCADYINDLELDSNGYDEY